MGSRISNGNNYMEEIENINEEELDLSNIDKLQIKALKELSKGYERSKRKEVRYNNVSLACSNL